MDLKLLDLFSGIGGFSYAAEKIVGGFTTTQFVEIDPYCQSVIKKNFAPLPLDKKRGGSKLSAIGLFHNGRIITHHSTRSRTMGTS